MKYKDRNNRRIGEGGLWDGMGLRDLVNVQPMTEPLSQDFYIPYMYTRTGGTTIFRSGDHRDPNYYNDEE